MPSGCTSICWGRNLNEGFEWDNNDFKTNMFMHPFHGSVYFNAARSNGYDFWEATAFTWAGSFIWEMFGENNRGAINDWVATSMGGMVLGEAFHRLRPRGPVVCFAHVLEGALQRTFDEVAPVRSIDRGEALVRQKLLYRGNALLRLRCHGLQITSS